MNGPAKLLNRNFILLIGLSFCTELTAQLLNTALPLYLVNAMGSTATISGILSALYTIIACVCRPFGGVWVDRIGRKPFIVSGMSIFVVGTLGFCFSTTVPTLVVFRCLQGLAFGVAAVASTSAASDNIPQARLGEGLGILGMCNALPMLIGPSMALLLIGAASYRRPFIGAVALCVLGLVCVLPVSEDREVFRAAAKDKHGITLQDLYEPTAVPPSIVCFFQAGAAACMMVYGALFAQNRGYTNASLFYIVSALGMIAIRMVISKFVDRVNAYYFVIPSFFCWAAAFAVMILSHDQNVFLICGAVYGMGLGIADTMLNTVGLRGVRTERRGAANATFLFAFDGGIGLFAMVLGRVIDVFSYDAMLWCGFVMLLICAALSILFCLRGGGKPIPVGE